MPHRNNLSVLARIPGYGGWVAADERNRDAELQEVKQAHGLMQIIGQQQAMQEKARSAALDVQMRDAVSQSGGDLEKAMQAAVASGNLAGAAKLAPLLEAQRKGKEGRIVPPGSHVLGPDNSVVHQVPFAPKERPEILKLVDELPHAKGAGMDFINRRLDYLTSRPDKQSQLKVLLDEMASLPADSPNRPHYERAISKFQPGGGTQVTVSPTISLGKPAQGKVDEGLLDTSRGVMALTQIEGMFKPEYQQAVPRLGAAWSSIKEKAGVGLSPQDGKFLQDFSAYKRNAINTMNEYIKSITGAAMSEMEAQRILRGMPNPGQGIIDGDSPTEFKAKLDDAMKQTKMALARYTYIKKNGGMSIDTLPLDKMPQIMNQRGQALEAQIKQANPNLNQQQVEGRVRQFLAQEFGLVQ